MVVYARIGVDSVQPLGGRAELAKWASAEFLGAGDAPIIELCRDDVSMGEAGHNGCGLLCFCCSCCCLPGPAQTSESRRV